MIVVCSCVGLSLPTPLEMFDEAKPRPSQGQERNRPSRRDLVRGLVVSVGAGSPTLLKSLSLFLSRLVSLDVEPI